MLVTHSQACGILVPWPGIELISLQWKQGVLITGQPRKSHSQELQELGGEGRALRPVSFRSESRGAPGSTGSQGIMLMVEMSELSKPSKPEEDLQDPGEAQGLEEAQLLGAEAGRAASASASSPRSPAPPLWRPCPRKLLMRW
ncbi:hypothetical protein CapIbe_023260 [Capra ibex]